MSPEQQKAQDQSVQNLMRALQQQADALRKSA
jgi:hypothetical protein